MCYYYPPDQEYYKNLIDSVMIIQCEINKAHLLYLQNNYLGTGKIEIHFKKRFTSLAARAIFLRFKQFPISFIITLFVSFILMFKSIITSTWSPKVGCSKVTFLIVSLFSPFLTKKGHFLTKQLHRLASFAGGMKFAIQISPLLNPLASEASRGVY